MNPPRTSVVMPTYNRADYLGAAIQSVLDQTFDDFELIVVDDGSTDGTEDLLRQVRDHRLRILRQEHGGISTAMNAGVRASTGSYIARLDSDDLWWPEMLATMVSALDAQPEVGFVYAKAEGMDAKGRPTGDERGRAIKYAADGFRSLLEGDCTCNITVVVRRDCFDRVGLYDPSLQTSEDWDMWLRVARIYRLAFVDRVVARYRWHPGNITGKASPDFNEVTDQRARVLDKVFDQFDLPHEIETMRPLAYRNLYLDESLRWVAVGMYGAAMSALGRAIRVSGQPAGTLFRFGTLLVSSSLARYSWGQTYRRKLANLARRWRLLSA